MAEDSGEPQRHGLGLLGIGHHEVCDAVERVEEKMRVDLSAQGAQLRLGHLLLQHRFTALHHGQPLFHVQCVEPMTELRCHAAQIIHFVRHQAAPRRTGRDGEHVGDPALRSNRNEQFDFVLGVSRVVRVLAIEFYEFAVVHRVQPIRLGPIRVRPIQCGQARLGQVLQRNQLGSSQLQRLTGSCLHGVGDLCLGPKARQLFRQLPQQSAVVRRTEDPTVHAFADTTVNEREQDQQGNRRQGLDACPGSPRICHAALESEERKDVVGQREGHGRKRRQHDLEAMTDKQIGKPETGEQEERA